MTLEEIKKFLNENKGKADIKAVLIAYLQGDLTVEEAQKMVSENKTLSSWLDSEKDKHLAKGLETWKTNNLQSEIDKEVKKRFPKKDEKEIELEKIKAQLQKMESEKKREELKNQAIKVANDKKLPLDIVDYFLGEDQETTTKNLASLEKVFNSHTQKIVDERLKGGYKPPGDNSGKTLTLEAIKNMSEDEINENWDAVQEVMKENQ
ncbi:DUF4355 domain-containing protein [Cytobacillus sp. IB215665]|uniref:DUF4355 domain-containing protein n=1 Tax=Cytobacillus sp. IB215665 TaxID=3097357 RepID=UPI002A0B363C|nr:DUF4355 domain-containing protein [Cytobacillus sp. IB215665]MDX8367852.1 DUF4355 domain-containing protein [Cytobacillus sp. IB215665]